MRAIQFCSMMITNTYTVSCAFCSSICVRPFDTAQRIRYEKEKKNKAAPVPRHVVQLLSRYNLQVLTSVPAPKRNDTSAKSRHIYFLSNETKHSLCSHTTTNSLRWCICKYTCGHQQAICGVVMNEATIISAYSNTPYNWNETMLYYVDKCNRCTKCIERNGDDIVKTLPPFMFSRLLSNGGTA